MSEDRVSGLQKGIKAERMKRQIAELWIQHMEGSLDREGCDRLCALVDESSLKSFRWGDAKSTKYLARVGVWYRDLADYARKNDCYEQIKQIEELIIDTLFSVGVYGEAEQRKKLASTAHQRHHDAFWQFLKRYEEINLAAD